MFHMVNSERAKHGLAPYKWNGKLATVAYYHCLDMMEQGNIFHYSTKTGNVDDRLRKYGLPYIVVGENCAFGNKSTWSLKYDGRVVFLNRGLFNSPGHRANLLNKSDFNEIGIAIIDDVRNSQSHLGAIYVCQIFRKI